MDASVLVSASGLVLPACCCCGGGGCGTFGCGCGVGVLAHCWGSEGSRDLFMARLHETQGCSGWVVVWVCVLIT